MEQKRVHVRDKHGNERWVTQKAVELVTKGYYTILDDSQVEKSTDEQPKKKEVVEPVVKEDDFTTVTFEESVDTKKPVKSLEGDNPVDEETPIEDLREEYLKLSGEDADKRWKENRLNEEIEKLKS